MEEAKGFGLQIGGVGAGNRNGDMNVRQNVPSMN